jgi:RimJ/RimL family protein N-acetyltransferase
MLEGLLVDLVPYGDKFLEQAPRWLNSEANFWADAGDRVIRSKAAFKRNTDESREHAAEHPPLGKWFGIQTKAGKPIGDIMLGEVMPVHRVAMLGAMIGEPEYWGGGYGTDALLLMVDYAFDWWDLRRVWLGTMSINARVIRQMEKVGFKLEARQRGWWFADGVWADDLVYGLLREEWPGRAAMVEKLGLRARNEE